MLRLAAVQELLLFHQLKAQQPLDAHLQRSLHPLL
jgi:hypothetical protein